MLASVGRGYSAALLLRGWEAEAPQLVPQLLQVLFEEAVPLLSTLSLVQVSPSGRTQDLLSPGPEDLSVLDVAPLGLVVEGASEVEVSDSRAASELYLKAADGESRGCSLFTLTMSCPESDPPEGPGTQRVWRGTLRILQLPEARDCPLLHALAGELAGEEMEGSLLWIVSWLLEGNHSSGLLLRLNTQGCPLNLLQAALLGASRRRMQVREVQPTLWDAVEEARTRRANLKTLRLGLLGDTLTCSGLNQLGRALQELQMIKTWSQWLRNQVPKATRDESAEHLETHVEGRPLKYFKQGRQHLSPLSVAGRIAPPLGSLLHLKPPFRDSKEQAKQTPDVALQFFLAKVRRQRLLKQHQILIQEELKHLEQERVAGEEVKGPVTEEACEERQRWHQEQTVLRHQVEFLKAERDAAEQDLEALYDLHVQATRAQTCHMLQVFQAWRGLWEEKATTTECHYRSLLTSVLQDAIDMASQNEELQVQNQRHCRRTGQSGAVQLDSHPGE
ncbi:uncharacterized protein RHO17_007712 [Thomomys bottae]